MRKKEQRRQQRQAAKWLLSLTNDMDWGLKTWDELEQKSVPKHRNTKQLLLSFLSKVPCAYPRRLSQRMLLRHFLGEETAYFTGSRGDETILLVDVDCHKTGSPEGARQFTEYLRAHFFPNLYYETSTNGNGIHGYLVVGKRQWGEADYNGTLKEVEKWLKRVLASTGFDVETVELKGRCPVVVWGHDYDRQVRHFVMGGLAKMPRDWTRLDEWKATTRITAHELRKLPELYPISETPKVKVHVEKQEAAGSVRGKLIDKELFGKHLPLAKRFLPGPEPVSAKSRVRVVAEDVAIFLVLLEFFAENPNPDGSMPYKRFASLWQRLYLDGDVERAFDNKRFAFVRNLVSDKGGIEWEDETYGEGKAAKWKASGELLGMMRECRVSLSTNNNYQRKLGGNKDSDPDRLWLEMTLRNGRNVGLRPVRVVGRAEKWVLADHLEGLEAMGLGWMAA